MNKPRHEPAFIHLWLFLGLLIFFGLAVLTLSARVSTRGLARSETRGPDEPRDRGRRNPSGGVQQAWVARYNGPANDVDVPETMEVDDAGNVYVSGYSAGS